jgi:hypothetical protein
LALSNSTAAIRSEIHMMQNTEPSAAAANFS